MLGVIFSKSFLGYSLMPRFVPRMRALAFDGFHYVPYFIALVYSIVRLLPAGHPYLNPANVGRFGLRHVIAEAANNLVFNRKNIDQIFLFSIVLVGLVVLVVQLALLVVSLIFFPAMAMPTNWSGFFLVGGTPAGTPNPAREQDLAFILLDLVFGVPYPGSGFTGGFFESCVGTATLCEGTTGNGVTDTSLASVGLGAVQSQLGPFSSGMYTQFPFPYHVGLHKLFAVYSNGILVVAVVIASYFVATVVAETAQSGVPMGRRYNKFWAPIRFVVAFGLLVPFTVGLNSSQYLVLEAAKLGSGFATNGWTMFNDTLTTTYLGEAQNLVSTPNVPEPGALTQFMYVARVCSYAYQYVGQQISGPPLPGTEPTSVGFMGAYVLGAQSQLPSNTLLITPTTSYQNVMDFLKPGTNNIVIRFGVKNEAMFPKERGFVKPYCGEVTMSLADPRNPTPTPPETAPEPGPYLLQVYYFAFIQSMWFDGFPFDTSGTPPQALGSNNRAHYAACHNIPGVACPATHNTPLASSFRNEVDDKYRQAIKAVIDGAVFNQAASASSWSGPFGGTSTDALYRKGWAAAGIWYNRVAELNGSLTLSVFNIPAASMYPSVMEDVRAKRAQYNQDTPNAERFNPDVSGIKDMSTLLGGDDGRLLATVMYLAYKDWNKGNTTTQTKPKGNAFLDAISSLLGTNGLYDMRRNTDTHPLAQLVGIGRSLVESSIRSLGFAAIAAVGGTGLGQLDQFVGQLGSMAASFFVTVAMIGLTAGFVLFYVVPFLPFIYFFFAVGGWVKGIFEAMVGAPLWALAHIRIDGHGLPGSAAMNGYFLIFEIFLRPILTIFGLLASISIFAALVKVLHDVFQLVTENVAGYDIEAEVTGVAGISTIDKMRGPIDRFFFTVVYAIIVYMMGMASFKMIDMVPNNILRWMGQSVASFNDQREDVAAGLVGKASTGSQQALSRIGQGLGDVAKLAKQV